MKHIQTDKAPAPGGHYSEAIVPTRDLHFGFKIEVDAVAAVQQA
jgi:hypothetical protein